jgi:hypothetical protein
MIQDTVGAGIFVSTIVKEYYGLGIVEIYRISVPLEVLVHQETITTSLQKAGYARSYLSLEEGIAN